MLQGTSQPRIARGQQGSWGGANQVSEQKLNAQVIRVRRRRIAMKTTQSAYCAGD
ncbi:hypothetical protein AB0D14_00620 [Streptomyces sp. NPDC048484]|uniref:hypothetical protein n=1 Tax=Streptomyces sp. NPDC048484 TaxID=3155146 RepID=UPI0034482AC0